MSFTFRALVVGGCIGMSQTRNGCGNTLCGKKLRWKHHRQRKRGRKLRWRRRSCSGRVFAGTGMARSERNLQSANKTCASALISSEVSH